MTVSKAEIKAILSTILECSLETITDETKLEEHGFDSLKFINTIVAIESKYDIEIRDSDLVLDKFTSVSAICKTLETYFSQDTLNLYKCVITDCDGVLWHGISGEEGSDKAYSDSNTKRFCQLLNELRNNGVLLAICSRNELCNITEMLAASGLSVDDFAIIETNVTNKIDTISLILDEFGFSEECAVYIDDSSSELDVARIMFPCLTTITADYDLRFINTFAALFQNLPKVERIDRTKKFKEQKEREKVHSSTTSVEEYNRILETNVICGKASSKDVERIAELSQRANRFNLTGARYSATALAHLFESNEYNIYRLCASDKFGDMGLIAMAVLHKTVIESFIMSCRVFGRGFEKELLAVIQQNCSDEVTGVYHPTGKNQYCKDFYANNGVKYEVQ